MPVEEKRDITACVPVCVDKGVQTDDDVGADVVPMDMFSRVVSHSYVSPPVRRCVGTAVRMHKGKDGCVRQLCGPGITILQGRAKKIHVPQTVPSRYEKKKVVAPKSKLMWRRKEAPIAVSSQVGREGGCGVEGKQDGEQA